MDMSAAYWAAVAENLPNAAVVFDSFSTVSKIGALAIRNLQRHEPVLPTHFPGPLYTGFTLLE
jgi:hypothetical protein